MTDFPRNLGNVRIRFFGGWKEVCIKERARYRERELIASGWVSIASIMASSRHVAPAFADKVWGRAKLGVKECLSFSLSPYV